MSRMASRGALLSSCGSLRHGRCLAAVADPRRRLQRDASQLASRAGGRAVDEGRLAHVRARLSAVQHEVEAQERYLDKGSRVTFPTSKESGGRPLNPKELNKRIQRTKSMEQLKVLLRGSFGGLTYVNIATSAVKLARIQTRCGEQADEVMEALVEASSFRIADFQGRQLSNLTWALSKYFGRRGTKPDLKSLLSAIEQQAVLCWHAKQFTAAHELSILLQSFAKLRHYPVELLSMLERELPGSATLAAFGPQEASNFLWACASLRHRRPALLDAVASQAVATVLQANPKELSISCWSLAKLHHASPAATGLLEAAAAAHMAPGSLARFNPMDLSNLAWACARLGPSKPASALMAVVVAEACPRLPEFAPQGLSNLTWAMAQAKCWPPGSLDSVAMAVPVTIGSQTPQGLANIASAFAHAEAPLTPQMEAAIDSLATSAAACAHKLDSQNMANLAWALGRLGHRSPAVDGLAQRLSEEASRHTQGFTGQGVANLLSGFAHLGVCGGEEELPAVCPQDLLEAFTPHVLRLCPHLGPQDVPNIAWAFARLQGDGSRVLPALASRAEELLPGGNLSPQGVSNLVWALGSANVYAAGLLDSVAAQVERGSLALGPFSEQALANLAWGFARLDYVRPDGLMRAVVREARSRLPALGPKAICSIVRSCADLAHPALPLFREVDEQVVGRLAEFRGAHAEGLMASYARMGYRSSAALSLLGQAAEAALQSLVNSPDFAIQSEWDLRRRRHYTALMVEVFCSGTLPNMPNRRVPGQLSPAVEVDLANLAIPPTTPHQRPAVSQAQ